MDLLAGWYPGPGEIQKIRRMSPIVREFISDASEEDPDFIEDYLLGVLDQENSEGILIGDMTDAVLAYEYAVAGLGDYEGNLGNLGTTI